MKVFLSWSWDRSRAVAAALRDWLPNVINVVEPWMSDKDIAAGARWASEIAGSLKTAEFGIICVTPENRDRPWLLFEAGALAKAFETARVVPYLFGFTDKSLPGSPLSQMHAKLADKADTFDLVKSLNDALNDKKLDAKRLEKAFAKWWPDLEEALNAIEPEEGASSPPRPSTDERLAELLDLARAQRAEIDAMHEGLRQQWQWGPYANYNRVLGVGAGIARMSIEAPRGIGVSPERALGRMEGAFQYPRTKDELDIVIDDEVREDDEPLRR